MDYMFFDFDVNQFINQWGYAGIFVISVWDRSGIPTALLAGGIIAAMGGLELHKIIISAFFGCCLGDQLFYLAGVLVRDRLKDYLSRRDKIRSYTDKIENWMRRYPRSIIFWCRFVPKIGKYFTGMAGVVRINYLRFIWTTAAGSLFYVFIFSGISYYFGETLRERLSAVQFVLFLIALSAAFLFYKVFKIREA